MNEVNLEGTVFAEKDFFSGLEHLKKQVQRDLKKLGFTYGRWRDRIFANGIELIGEGDNLIAEVNIYFCTADNVPFRLSLNILKKELLQSEIE